MPVSVSLQGARIRTLPASLSPVIIGVCCAWETLHTTHHLQVNYPLFWIETVLCLGIAFFLQIAANFANDYSDGKKGTDAHRVQDENQTGLPQRLTASGLLSDRAMIAIIMIMAACACFCGTAAIYYARAWWFFLLGLLCLLAGWFYTGGKHPYGYHGWGEVAVFLFFGIVAVYGTYFLVLRSSTILGRSLYSPLAVGASCISGFYAVIVLMVNNLRDINTDSHHKKRTLEVHLGWHHSLQLFISVECIAWCLTVYCAYSLSHLTGILLACCLLPFLWRILNNLKHHSFRSSLATASITIILLTALFILWTLLPLR